MNNVKEAYVTTIESLEKAIRNTTFWEFKARRYYQKRIEVYERFLEKLKIDGE